MAITDPQAIKFSNERVRTLADIATKYYYAARAFQNEWDATSMNLLISLTATFRNSVVFFKIR